MVTSKGVSLYRSRVKDVLTQVLSNLTVDERIAPRLLEAIHYMLLTPHSKYLRPSLLYVIGEALGASLSLLDPLAASIEMIHTYSLIHDDLPAMDNDDFRRGRLACHKAFDEATAILAGDVLQMLACQTILDSGNGLTATQRLDSIDLLAKESGLSGMASGQMMDLNLSAYLQNEKTLETMHLLKTASLIKASLFLGAIAAKCEEKKVLENLSTFAEHIGLAFQITDDILDVEGESETLGKTAGKDVAQKKMTYPALIGLDRSKEKAKALYEQSLDLLKELPFDTTLLATFAKAMVFRLC